MQYQTLYIVHWILGRSYENSISTKTSSLPDLSQNYIPVQDESYSQNVSLYSLVCTCFSQSLSNSSYDFDLTSPGNKNRGGKTDDA